MRIQGIEVDGFGVWTGLALKGIGEAGLGVIFGPNEAGKTTLLELVRAVLYGFSPARRRYLPPRHGGAWGGWLELRTAEGLFRVGRHLDEGPAGREEHLQLIGPDGQPGDGRTLGELLFDVDEQTFDHVFAVGLRELQYLGTLDESRAAALLYNLSIGLDRVNLAEVMGQLAESRNQILDACGGAGQLLRLHAERAELSAEIEGLAGATRRYERLAQEQQRIDEQLAALDEQLAQCQRQARLVELAASLREPWAQRRQIDDELAAMGAVRRVPKPVAERLDHVAAQLRAQEEQLAAVRAERARLKDELRALAANQALRREAHAIEALAEQKPRLVALREEIDALRAEVERLEAELRDRQEQLGFDPQHQPAALLLCGTGEQPGAWPASGRRVLARLHGPAALMRSARAQWQDATRIADEAQQRVAQLEAELRSALGTQPAGQLSAALEQASELLGHLRRRVRLDERLEQLAAGRRELEEQARSLVARQLLPGWVLAGLGAVFVLGMVLVLVGLLMPESITGSLGWAMALLGLGGAAVAGLGKWLLERAAAARLEACQVQLRMLEGQLEHAQQQRDELDRHLLAAGVALSPEAVQTRLQETEQQLATLEAAVPLQSRLAAAREEAETAASRAATAEGQFAQARRQWRESLASVGLPGRLSPRGVRRYLRQAAQLEPLWRRWSLAREQLRQRGAEFEALTQRISRMAEQLGLAAPGAGGEELLARLIEALRAERALAARRRELRRQHQQLLRQQWRGAAAVRRWQGLRRELLRRCGARSEQQLRELAARAARVELLRKQREQLDQTMAQAIGSPQDQAAVWRLLEAQPSAEQLAERCAVLRQEQERLDGQRACRYEQRGRLSAQMQALAADRTLPRKQLELNRLEQRIAEATQRWQVLAAACRIFDELKRNYEKHRQPETLLEASGYLARLTAGRYVRVWTPLDCDTLRVDVPEGGSLPVEALSRGTREQLFLALRLALAACFARRGMPLPLVLDDVLVNFDTPRAKAAAAVLRDFAEAGHQVLLFTCHDHLLKLFKSLKAPIAELPDSSQAPAGSVYFSAPARARRQPMPGRSRGGSRSHTPNRPPTAEVDEQPPPAADAGAVAAQRDRSAGVHGEFQPAEAEDALDSLGALPPPPPVAQNTPEEVPHQRRAAHVAP